MSSIGAINTTTFGLLMMQGLPAPSVSTYIKDGRSGVERQTWPARPREVSGPTTTDYASQALADAAVPNYYALIGTTVTVTDQFGATYLNVTVKDCQAVAIQTLTGGRVLAQWVLLPANP